MHYTRPPYGSHEKLNGKTNLIAATAAHPSCAEHAPAHAPDNVRIAIFAIVLAVFVLSLGDALVKFVAADFSLWQLYVLRSLFAIPVLIAIIKLPMASGKWHAPGGSFRPVALGWTAFRSFMMVVMWAIYYTALPHITFSVAASVLYTIPLFITLLSVCFVGDRVSVAVWLAVGFGFAGVLVIVRPTADDFNLYALLPLLSAMLFAWAMILTRTKCRRENPKVLALWQNLMFVITGSIISGILLIWQPHELAALNPFLFGGWMPLGGVQWLVVIILATTVVIGNISGAFAYQRGPSAVVATFDNTYLIFSLLWGFLLFVEIPDVQAIIGMAMIAASGILTVWLSRK